MAYSADLRNKALNYYEQCKNISQTAATFNLSRNTLYLWIRLKKQTGSLKHQVTGLNAVKLDRQKLAQYTFLIVLLCLNFYFLLLCIFI